MDPTLGEKQNDQAQERRGIISRGINSFNSLRGANRLFSNPFGKIGSRVATQTALRDFAALLAGPGLPVAIALGLVLLFTVIIIMGFGGAPPFETSIQTPTVPIAEPTKLITPTPAL